MSVKPLSSVAGPWDGDHRGEGSRATPFLSPNSEEVP